MKIPSLGVPNISLIKNSLDFVKRDEETTQDSSMTSAPSTTASQSLKDSLRSSLSMSLKSMQAVYDECSDEESDNEHFICSNKSIMSHYDNKIGFESYCEHDSGSLNLMDSCIMSQHHQSLTQDKNKKISETRKNNNASFLLDLKSFDDSMILPHETEDVSIHDTAVSIINSNKSWEEMRKRIRAKNLVTSLGVIETCLSFFEEEAYKLQKKRIEEQRLARSQLPSISRFRRRLSLF